jgi:hypothetical protein
MLAQPNPQAQPFNPATQYVALPTVAPQNPPAPQPKSGFTVKKAAIAAVGAILAMAAGYVGSVIDNKTRKSPMQTSAEADYGISGMMDNGTHFCGVMPIMPVPYVWGLHRAANATWEVKTNASIDNPLQCEFNVDTWKPLPINATYDGSISWEVRNPTEHRDLGRKAMINCTGSQDAFLFLNATYESEGKRVEQNTTVQFNPAACH